MASFPAAYADIKNFCESLKRWPDPDLILCHEREDRHQDHRVVNEMIWSTFRRNVVLEYEIPKWDGGLGQPNVYVPVSAKDATAKVDALLTSYSSQAGRDWFTGKPSWRCSGCAGSSVVHPVAMRRHSTVTSSFSRAAEAGCRRPGIPMGAESRVR